MGKAQDSTEVLGVFKTLSKDYPDTSTELTYESPFQLIIAVILSAQCTDARVNQTTPSLFHRFPTPEKLSTAKQSEVEKLIHSCGFYRQKAKSIIATSKDIVERFAGEVPKTLEELTTLRGVGRKTASVVLNQAFDLPAIAVDTHVKRVSHRIGWTQHTDPEKVEWDLRDCIPERLWSQVNGILILHGRRVCVARRPKCELCSITEFCKYFPTAKPR